MLQKQYAVGSVLVPFYNELSALICSNGYSSSPAGTPLHVYGKHHAAVNGGGLAYLPSEGLVCISFSSQPGLPAEQMFYCGLAPGYAAMEHAVNKWRTSRAGVAEFAKLSWFERSEGSQTA